MCRGRETGGARPDQTMTDDPDDRRGELPDCRGHTGKRESVMGEKGVCSCPSVRCGRGQLRSHSVLSFF